MQALEKLLTAESKLKAAEKCKVDGKEVDCNVETGSRINERPIQPLNGRTVYVATSERGDHLAGMSARALHVGSAQTAALSPANKTHAHGSRAPPLHSLLLATVISPLPYAASSLLGPSRFLPSYSQLNPFHPLYPSRIRPGACHALFVVTLPPLAPSHLL